MYCLIFYNAFFYKKYIMLHTILHKGIVSVVRPLVRGGEDYPEGPTHVVPLLMACLPAIDPNDIRKTLVKSALNTISHINDIS